MSFSISLDATLATTKQQIHESFADFIAQQNIPEPKLANAIEYALLSGGKRIRPLLINLIGKSLGLSQTDLTPIGLAVECIHCYSLVHDDLPAMDDDDLRRGKPTCHIVYDEATAILAGDALQCMAFEVLASAHFSIFADKQRVELIALLSKAAGGCGMVAGQSIDLVSTNKQINIEQLTELHRLKTGALLEVCGALPCAISEHISIEHAELFRQFARHIGLAFQIQDDILDVTADTDTLGKPQGSDELANKSTFVSLLGLDGAKKELDKQHSKAVNALANLPYNTDELLSFTDFMVTRAY
ncbi:polyprenyl synthetase family protein [Glaciecola petra]|uniref:Polyprenyl synthetase family protein n=1 Tax=Glaciecola petra TaxID=3075602 RepID=A0ABU2ZTY5_9ALTE|nr:farnesyl diphosphate synthase [Aestuariibacter sp. P117]MDT0595779.1 polyprenyl synthetase family protein [Aestuariibacter sp. P117]